MSALIFIVYSLFRLILLAFLLRVLLPLGRADARNPVSRFVIQFTNPIVLPLRKVFAPLQRLDIAALIALVVVQLTCTAVLWLLRGHPLSAYQPLLIFASYDLLIQVLDFYFYAILIYALLSWVAQDAYSPVGNVLASLVMPVLAPFRRLIPPLGGLDLSAAFAAIAIKALEILLADWIGSRLIIPL